MSRRVLWLLLGVVGVGLLFPFEHPLTLALGVLCLVAFVAWGVVLIATPELIERADDDGP